MFWTRETISLISIGAVCLSASGDIGNSGIKSGKTHACVFRKRGELFYRLFVDINSQCLDACHFAAFPVYRIEAVDYPATRPADSNCNYPHTMILYSPVIFRMKVLLYYVRSDSISYRIIVPEEKKYTPVYQMHGFLLSGTNGNPNKGL